MSYIENTIRIAISIYVYTRKRKNVYKYYKYLKEDGVMNFHIYAFTS